MVEHSAGKARLKYQLDARLLPHEVVLALKWDPTPSSCAAKTRWNNGAGLADVFGVFSSPQGFPRPLRWRTGSAPRHAAGGTRPWHGTRQVVARGWCAHSWLSLLKNDTFGDGTVGGTWKMLLSVCFLFPYCLFALSFSYILAVFSSLLKIEKFILCCYWDNVDKKTWISRHQLLKGSFFSILKYFNVLKDLSA